MCPNLLNRILRKFWKSETKFAQNLVKISEKLSHLYVMKGLGVVHILRNQGGGGGGVSKWLRLITRGEGGGLANDYVIKNIRIFYKFLLNFKQILSQIFKIFSGFGCTN